MSNPQLENGYIKIANELWENLNKIYLSDGERRVLGVVIRKTYGFNKAEDKISYSQFCKETGLSRNCVIKSRNKLVKKCILGSHHLLATDVVTYWIIKDYDKWYASHQLVTSQQMYTRASHQTIKTLVNKRIPTKDIYTKDNINTRAVVNKCLLEEKFSYLKNESFNKAYQEFLLMRKKIRKPTTERAEELILKKLHEYSMPIAITMLENSIVNSWQNVYEIKQSNWTNEAEKL